MGAVATTCFMNKAEVLQEYFAFNMPRILCVFQTSHAYFIRISCVSCVSDGRSVAYVFHAYFMRISSGSHAYFMRISNVSCVSHAHIMRISCVFHASHACPMRISCVFHVYLMRIACIFHAYPAYLKQLCICAGIAFSGSQSTRCVCSLLLEGPTRATPLSSRKRQ